MKKIFTEAFSVNLIIVLMLIALGSISAQSEISSAYASQKAIYQGNAKGKVSLMINVYDNPEKVKEYADILHNNDVPATFFIGGTFAEKNSEIITYLSDKNFEIGNHGYSHKTQTKLDENASAEEISKTNGILKKIIQKDVKLFAPPYGDVDEKLVSIAANRGCQTIMWTVDTIDWRDHDCDKICSRIKRNLKDGALILTHPTDKTVESLSRIIEIVRSAGYDFCTVGENIK